MKKKLEVLFENLCCAKCRRGFDINSIDIGRYQQDLIVANLECKECGMKFGVAFIGLSGITIKEPLEVNDKPDPITCDDVIDAHKFIQELDEHWQEHLPKTESQQ